MSYRVPFFRPEYDPSDGQSVIKLLESRHEYTKNSFYTGELSLNLPTKHEYVVPCTSATMGLWLVYRYLLECKGISTLIAPDYTYKASTDPAYFLGYSLKIVGSDQQSYMIDFDEVIRCRGDVPTKSAVVVAAMHGFTASDYSARSRDLKDMGLVVIYDLAQHPLVDDSESDYSVYSFVQGKLINCGEGGAVATDDKDFYLYASRLIDQVGVPSLNLRLSAIQLSMVVSQLKRIHEIVKERYLKACRYQYYLSKLGFQCSLSHSSIYTMFPVPSEIIISDCKLVQSRMILRGVDCKVYPTLTEWYRGCDKVNRLEDITQDIYCHTSYRSTYMSPLILPFWRDIPDEDIEHVVNLLRDSM